MTDFILVIVLLLPNGYTQITASPSMTWERCQQEKARVDANNKQLLYLSCDRELK